MLGLKHVDFAWEVFNTYTVVHCIGTLAVARADGAGDDDDVDRGDVDRCVAVCDNDDVDDNFVDGVDDGDIDNDVLS